VSTSKFVRKEGDVIRHNMGWTFILLAYLIHHRDRVLPGASGGDDGELTASGGGEPQNALSPVSSRPMVSW